MPDLPTGWHLRTVESICKRVTSGGTPSRRNPDFYRNGTINWFKTGELRDRSLYESEEKITAQALEASSAKVFPPDTVLLALYGDGDTITCLGFLRRPAATNQACCAMIVNENEANARFLFYALKETRDALLRVVVGGAQRNLSGKLVREHLIPVPPLNEQHAIAGVLGALDEKIEQNRRTSRALERLARAIFRAWFIDFEPVHAKAAGATSFPSMPQDVFDSLPTTFTPSALGPIPEGWRAKPLSQVFDVNPPRELSKGAVAPYLDMKNMPTSGHAPDSWIDRPAGSGMRFVNGDTLVARITPCLENGKTAYVDFLQPGQVAWGSTEYIVLRPKEPIPAIFAYCLARTNEFREFAFQNMSGTSGRQRVSPTTMNHFDVVEPPTECAVAFGEIAAPIFDSIRAAMNESRKLAELRDYLLPKLLSGEVRVEMAPSIAVETI